MVPGGRESRCIVGVFPERNRMSETAPRPSMPRVRRSIPLLAALLAAAVLAACTREMPLQPEHAAVPGAPSMLVNPLCTGSGGTTHTWNTITTTEHWYASGNPHRVTGWQYVAAGGQLRIHPGVLVCLDPVVQVYAYDGGHVSVDGDDTAQVVLTASDPAQGWGGFYLIGTPGATSFIGHTRIEMVAAGAVAVQAHQDHEVVLDHVVIRQSGRAVVLDAPGSRIIDSRVDTTTYRYMPAVLLGDSTRFTRTTVREAAGSGVEVWGQSGVELLGGRIEGSGETGLEVRYAGAVSSFQPIRVTGGSSYGAVMPIDALARGYGSVAEMDSLLGNGRDTVVVLGGTLTTAAYATAGLPWRVDGDLSVDAGGSLRPQPGAKLFMAPNVRLRFPGGRLLARGTQAAPVLFTADDPALGWGGIDLWGTPSSTSFVTNARVEHVNVYYAGVSADAGHPVVIDSAVFRQVGRAASLQSYGSRMSRTRVDTTLSSSGSAVELASNARLESTLIRGSSGHGVGIWAATVQIVSCEVRGSVGNGVYVSNVYSGGAEVRNCNLVDNGGVGVGLNFYTPSADAEGNWWGDAAGPTGTNGDGAAGGVDYTPWLTAPYALPYVP
jgi:hypothetical protein